MRGAPWPNDWANVDSIDFFLLCGFHVLVKGNWMEFKDLMVLHWFSEVKGLNGLKLCLVGIFQSHI